MAERESRDDELSSWLLGLASDTLVREESIDTAHDIDHVERTMRLAKTLHEQEGGDLPTILAAMA